MDEEELTGTTCSQCGNANLVVLFSKYLSNGKPRPKLGSWEVPIYLRHLA